MSTPTDRLDWFRRAKLGMFVHWGCYSTLCRGEQAILRDHMPLAEYLPIADRFKPASDWADAVADQAVRMGARYVVLTTRHHDGYCLFDTRADAWNAATTGPGRDLIVEYVAALRKRGLKVGFYYSLVNWRQRSMWDPSRYGDGLPGVVEQVHTQVTELMSRYGPIDVLWYDVPMTPAGGSPGAFGYTRKPQEITPAEFYRSAELNAQVRRLQPHILINNRSGLPEDFGTPEQHVAADEVGRMWESCMTRNFAPNWGCVNHSVADKPAGQILFHLMDAMRKGGNFLFNIGPDARGYVTPRDRGVLDEIGRWVGRHAEAVYDAGPDPITAGQGQGPCFHYGMFTCRDRTAYLTLFFYPSDAVVISKVGGKLLRAELLTTGQPLTVEPLANERYRIAGLPAEMPDPLAVVLKLQFAQPPYQLSWSGGGWLDGKLQTVP